MSAYPACDLPTLVVGRPAEATVDVILNNSFGMMGINCVAIVGKYKE